MAIFGRRNPLNMRQHVVTPEAWEDPSFADFFSKIRARPDDRDNLAVTAADIQHMIDEGRKALQARVLQLQARARAKGHDNLRLRPFWLIQDNCWNGEVGDFLLYTLRLNPYEEWNTIILPTDEESARLLGLPQHPGRVLPDFAKIGEEVILDLRNKLRAAHAEVQRTHEFGRFSDLHDETVAQVKKLALVFASHLADAQEKGR